MSSEPAVLVNGVTKSYHIYRQPHDRLKQGLLSFSARHVRHPALAKKLGDAAVRVAHVHHALTDISFSVQRGESLAIIGRNGSGKSTLLQTICGTLSPSAGTVVTNGRVAALLELGAGFNPEFTGRENVFLNGQLLGLSRREIATRLESIAAFADIGPFFDEPVRTYSSGMFVRLAFAVIAHVDADILIIDEALAVGDALFNQKCMRFLRDFMMRGTLLFVSHDLGSVKALCQRAVWLDQGRLKMDAAAKDVADAYLRTMFESLQGTEKTASGPVKRRVARVKDRRFDLLDRTSLRNDLVVHRFDVNAEGFGRGSARILHAAFTNEEGEALNMIVGGELVRLEVQVRSFAPIERPIVGFFVRDRLGQELFGDNTFVSSQLEPLSIDANETFRAVFDFEMPRLPRGQYSIVVAIAEGTQTEHVQHHWLNDAVIFESHTTSVAQGLIGIAMSDVLLEKTVFDTVDA